jgi:nucleoside-diphosphate-sugar epimerase
MMQRVFVTGATGYLGSAIAARLVRAGHDVHGLARTPERASLLEAMGVKATIGELALPDSFISELKNSDAVVHAAQDEQAASTQDQLALEAFRAAARDGRVRRLLYTSGVWVHGDTGGAIADETAPLDPAERVRWRPAHEEAALDLSTDDVVTVVLRPGMVYGERRGILGDWFLEAKEKRTVSFPGDGTQHWSMVHRDDLADAYALALEHAQGGERYLLVDESRFTVGDLATAVAATTGARAIPAGREETLRSLGTYGAALLLDQQFTAAKARRELGWVPRHSSFVAEVAGLMREWQAAAQAAVG